MTRRQPGARTTDAIADVLSSILTRHRAATLPGEKAAQRKLVKSMLEEAERVHAPIVREVFQALGDMEELPQELRSALQQISNPRHQWSAILTGAAIIGFAMDVMHVADQGWLRAVEQDVNRRQPNAKLTPEQAAAGYVRGLFGADYMRNQGAAAGLDASHMDYIAGLIGNPPAIQQLQEAWRRNIIGTARLEQGIRESDLRNEWIDVIKALRFSPLDPSTAVAGVVQNQISTPDARRKAAEAGLDPDDFDLAVRVAGSPPGVMEMIELWQRGEITQADVEQVIRESRVKTKYIGALLKFRRQLLPADTIAGMVAHGVLSDGEGIRKLMEHGYTHEDAAAWIDRASLQATQATRDLTSSEIQTLYEGQSIKRDEAERLLGSLGYATGEVGLVLDLADSRRLRAARDQAVSRIHSLYVSFRIERDEAASAIGRVGVGAEPRRELLALWDLERAANTRDLTKAEIVSAYKHEVFTLREAVRRLEGIGYRGVDAVILLALVTPPLPQGRELTTAQILAAVKRKQITSDEGMTRLLAAGYDRDDARLLLAGVQ